MFNNYSVIEEGVVKYCDGNPFMSKEAQMMNIVSNMPVPETAKEYILTRNEKDEETYKVFASEINLIAKVNLSSNVWNKAEGTRHFSKKDTLQTRKQAGQVKRRSTTVGKVTCSSAVMP